MGNDNYKGVEPYINVLVDQSKINTSSEDDVSLNQGEVNSSAMESTKFAEEQEKAQRYVESSICSSIYADSFEWKDVTTVHVNVLKELLHRTGIDVKSTIGDVSVLSSSHSHCTNVYSGCNHVQYYIASKLLENNQLYYLNELFGVNPRQGFSDKREFYYRDGVSSEVAILIDKSGRSEIFKPSNYDALYGQAAQKHIANAFHVYQSIERLVENPIELQTFVSVMKTLGVKGDDVDAAQKNIGKMYLKRSSYDKVSLYEKIYKDCATNTQIIEFLDKYLTSAQVADNRRETILNSFIESVEIRDGIDFFSDGKDNVFDGKTIEEGLKLIGMSDDEIKSLPLNGKELDDDFNIDRFSRKGIEGCEEYVSPYRKKDDLQRYRNMPDESIQTFVDHILEHCKKTGDIEYALEVHSVPSQKYVAMEIEKRNLDPNDVLRDSSALIPELKGALRRRDLIGIDLSECFLIKTREDGEQRQEVIQNVETLVDFLEAMEFIVNTNQSVLTPKFFDSAERLKLPDGYKFDEIIIPQTLKDDLVSRAGEQIDWDKVSLEDIKELNIGTRSKIPDLALMRFLKDMGMDDVWTDVLEVNINGWDRYFPLQSAAKHLLKKNPDDAFLKQFL